MAKYRYITYDEIKSVILYTERIRDRIIVMLMYHTGAKPTQIVRMRTTDIFADGRIRLPSIYPDSFHMHTIIEIPPPLHADLWYWAQFIQQKGGNVLFPSTKGAGLPGNRTISGLEYEHDMMRPERINLILAEMTKHMLFRITPSDLAYTYKCNTKNQQVNR